jgi:hypothetical protein
MANTAYPKIARGKESAWQFVFGLLVAELGLFQIGLGGWDALNTETQILMYISGGICLIAGLFLVWKDTIRTAGTDSQSTATVNGMYLGKFELNNQTFDAYERDATDGRREFRLVSHPALSAVQEAAFVRYMVNEGHIENIWPHMSKQIEEDAGWAFAE